MVRTETLERGLKQATEKHEQTRAAVQEEIDVETSSSWRPKAATTPPTPTEKEVEQHELAGHCPFRSWCRVCVQGKALDDQHRRMHQRMAFQLSSSITPQPAASTQTRART